MNSNIPSYALVSTARFLLLVNINNKMVVVIEDKRQEYYGISWFPGQVDLVLSHSGLDNANLIDINNYAQSEVGYLSSGTTETPPFLSQTHQILCASDGRVLSTNTGRNCITAIDISYPKRFHEAQISKERWDRLSLTNTCGDHLNSVFEIDGILYVLAHGFDKGAKLARFSYPDMDLIDVNPIVGRTCVHNIWVTPQGQKIVCDSRNGSLIEANTNSVLWSSGRSIFTRGLAATNDIVLIGESALAGRDVRSASMAAIWILDRQTWRALDYIPLGPYGAVNEVRLLDVPDLAHHGHVFSGLDALIKRNLYNDLKSEKMYAENLMWRHKAFWAKHDSVFGSPQFNEKAELRAESAALITLKECCAETIEIAFEYELGQESGQSHVSVISYRGDGDDNRMDALLLLSDGEGYASLAEWTQDGDLWHRRQELASNLPLKGHAIGRIKDKRLWLFVNDVEVGHISLNANEPVGKIGIRWYGGCLKFVSDS